MNRTLKLRPVVLLIAIGGHGLVVQVVLLRELMAAFAGNELSAGLMVGVWIASEALGAWLFGRIVPASTHKWLQALGPVSAIASVGAVLFVILGRSALGALPGESLNIPALVGITALAVLVPALTHGGLFVLGTMLQAQTGPGQGGVGRGYVWEGVGTALAAFLTWFFLLPHFPSLAIVAFFGMPLAAGVGFKEGNGSRVPGLSHRMAPARTQSLGSRTRTLVPLAPRTLFLLLLAVVAWFAGPIERWAWESHWPGQRVVEISNSPYGKVIRLEREDQSLVVYNGVTALSVPSSDEAFIEELAHLPLLVHPMPRRVLVLGTGTGFISSILRQPVESVTLVQLDQVLGRATSSAADTVLVRALADSRLRLVYQDPRDFLARACDSFDCIILTDIVPYSLAGSRMFTLEFFRLCRRRLAQGGVMALPGPGSATRVLPETRQILRVRQSTLEAVFPEVNIVLADFPVFFAAEEPIVFRAETLAARLVSRGVETRVLDSSYIASLFDPFRQGLFLAGMEEDVPGSEGTGLNTDVLPRELYLTMVRENRISSPGFGGLYAAVGRFCRDGFETRPYILLILAGLVLAVYLAGGRAKGVRFSRAAGVGTSGFAGAAITTLAVFIYQVRFGSVYSGVGLLLATFMLGVVLGGVLGTGAAENASRITHHASSVSRRIFLGAELGLVMAAGLLLVLIRAGPPAAFLAVLLLAGAAVGVQFPIAGAELRASTVGRKAGLLTALDLTGGFIGALATALFLVPVFGLAFAATVIVAVKLISAVGQVCCRASSD